MTNSGGFLVKGLGYRYLFWHHCFFLFPFCFNFHLGLDDVLTLLPGWHDWPPVAATCRSPNGFRGFAVWPTQHIARCYLLFFNLPPTL